MIQNTKVGRSGYNTVMVSTIYHGTEKEMDVVELVANNMLVQTFQGRPEQREKEYTNFRAIKNMDEEELSTFLEDVANYDNPDHEWHSHIEPLLPFEDWREWLNRRVIYDTDK